MIEFVTDPKIVTKPWGQETWLQPGTDVYPFVLKRLILRAGNRTSLQVHQVKSETIQILSGSGILIYHPERLDCERYLAGGYDLDLLKQHLIERAITAGDVFHTPPGTIHRMLAHTDLDYMEASTCELDDVIRLQDDSRRAHGRIAGEHGR